MPFISSEYFSRVYLWWVYFWKICKYTSMYTTLNVDLNFYIGRLKPGPTLSSYITRMLCCTRYCDKYKFIRLTIHNLEALIYTCSFFRIVIIQTVHFKQFFVFFKYKCRDYLHMHVFLCYVICIFSRNAKIFFMNNLLTYLIKRVNL